MGPIPADQLQHRHPGVTRTVLPGCCAGGEGASRPLLARPSRAGEGIFATTVAAFRPLVLQALAKRDRFRSIGFRAISATGRHHRRHGRGQGEAIVVRRRPQDPPSRRQLMPNEGRLDGV